MVFSFRAMLTNPSTGQLYKEGEIMKHIKLANTLEAIANEGPDAFYNGSLTQDILLDIQDAGTYTVKHIKKETNLKNHRLPVKPITKISSFISLVHGQSKNSSSSICIHYI